MKLLSVATSACGQISEEKHTGHHVCKYTKHIKLDAVSIWEHQDKPNRIQMNSCNIIFNMQMEIYWHESNYSISRSVCVCLHQLHLTCDSLASQNLTCVTCFEACHIQYHCRSHDLTDQRVKV